MKIAHLKLNHLENPIGFDIENPTFSFIVEESTGTRLKKAKITVAEDKDMQKIVYDSGDRTDLDPLAFTPDFRFSGGKRYYWTVSAEADDGDRGVSEPAFFEGGKDGEWDVPFITSPFNKSIHPVFFRDFEINGKIKSARLYITGLGLYEAYINGEKAGDEYLAPFYNDYRNFVQYQTIDIKELLKCGKNNIYVLLGNGWYKGRFGYIGHINELELFGDSFLLSAELDVVLENGEKLKLPTDKDWYAAPSPVTFSGIYDGEHYDSNIPLYDTVKKSLADGALDSSKPVLMSTAPKGRVIPRISPRLTSHEEFSPKELIITKKGEQVLDFGQEISGFIEFDCHCEKGTEIYLQMSEIMQDGCFYNDNLRTARAEYKYISNGEPAHCRPHFTFYGFRYVKVEGVKLDDKNLSGFNFSAVVIHSDLERTGFIKTSDQKLNRFIENTLWGQKGNFLDVPTDCPQRDERLGWTGDAQVFCATACYHMDCAAFYQKYMFDMLKEQRENDGAVPYVVPDTLNIGTDKVEPDKPMHDGPYYRNAASCAWGDAATVIPYTNYIYYGDKKMLEKEYENMKLWTDFIINIDNRFCGGGRLWNVGFHFADWLALDNPNADEGALGRTDSYFVASVYYYYSASLTSKAAAALGLKKDAEYYGKIAKEVMDAMRKEYVTATGRLAVDTQTALVLAIYFDIVPQEFIERTAADLKEKLGRRKMHLDTGFVGTAYLCKALTKAGLNKEAYTLLFNEDYPSWLYEVNMGATTVWERWNSVLPDGSISDTGMNSLNHYAYGAVAEWIYGTVCGLAPDENAPGFKRAVIAPVPDERLKSAQAEYRSASGRYTAGWKNDGTTTEFFISVPFNCEAEFIVPDGYEINGLEKYTDTDSGRISLKKGEYRFTAKSK